MATRILSATGGFVTAATWFTAEPVSELDSEAGNNNPGTVAGTNTDSSTFTPGAVTVRGIGVKIKSLAASPTGTLKVTLRNSTGSTDVASVTINMSDLQPNAYGWVFFDFGAQLLLASTAYLVRVVQSVASTVTLWTNGTTNNWSRELIQTLDASSVSQAIAPAANDKIIFAGVFTGAGTSTTYTCTFNNTATTSFGPVVSGGPPQGVTSCDKSIVQLGSAASTAYFFKWKGVWARYAGSQVLMDNASGTTGSITGATNTGSMGNIWVASNSSGLVNIYSPGHGLSTNDYIQIIGCNFSVSGVMGNYPIDGLWQVTNVDSNNFTLQTSSWLGTWVFQYQGQWFRPITITSTAHGLTSGQQVVISGVVGNTNANGAWFIQVPDANHFILDGAQGNAAYTSGGTWSLRQGLTSTSTFEGYMDAAANVDTGIIEYQDCIVSECGASKTVATKMATGATNSLGALVTVPAGANPTITWIEGAQFDNVNWPSDASKTCIINGTTYTVTSVPSATTLVISGTPGALTAATFVYTGTSANKAVTVGDTTGWAANDVLAFASSSTRYQDAEKLTVNAVSSSTQVTVTTAPQAYHSGLSDTNGDVRAEVLNLTRSISWHGASSSLCGYIQQNKLPNVNTGAGKRASNYVEYYNLGSATAATQGIVTQTATAFGWQFQHCSFHDSNASGFWNAQNNAGMMCPIIRSSVFYNFYYQNTATSGSSLLDGNYMMCPGINQPAVFPNDLGGIFTNATISSCQNFGISLSEQVAMLGVWYGLSIHSNGRACIDFNSNFNGGPIGNGTVTGCRYWRNSSNGPLYVSGQTCPSNNANVAGLPVPTVDGATIFGCTTGNTTGLFGTYLGGTFTGPYWIRNVNADAGVNIAAASTQCFVDANGVGVMLIDNCQFGQKQVIQEVNFQPQANIGGVLIVFRNCLFANTAWVANNDAGGPQSKYTKIVSLSHNQTSGSFQGYRPGPAAATLFKFSSDTVIFHTASPSTRWNNCGSLTLNARTDVWYAPCANGTTLTPGVWVRQSSSGDAGGANYNGLKPRLILLADPSIGINVDTVIATAAAAVGTWEQLTGTTPSFTGDGVARFCVDWGGTAGWINTDDFTPGTGAQDSKGFQFWSQDAFGPFVAGVLGASMLVHPGMAGGARG